MIGRGRISTRAWWPWLSLWTALGLGIRLASLFGPHRSGRTPGGDAFYYHHAANLLVAGDGFINPFVYYSSAAHHQVQTAAWPPLFVFVLAVPSLVGLKSFFAHRVWCCMIGAAGVAVTGYAGRSIAGRRVGLIAAFLVAVYPNLWMSDELGLSEALSPVLVALVLWSAYRFWKRPGLVAGGRPGRGGGRRHPRPGRAVTAGRLPRGAVGADLASPSVGAAARACWPWPVSSPCW